MPVPDINPAVSAMYGTGAIQLAGAVVDMDLFFRLDYWHYFFQFQWLQFDYGELHEAWNINHVSHYFL